MNENQLEEFKKAQNAIESQNFKLSTDILLNLYDEVDQANVVRLLGKSLYNEKKYVEAGRLIDDNFDFFLVNDPNFLCKVLLKNHRYIDLRIIANGLSKQEQNDFLQRIKADETKYQQNQSDTIHENSREFMHLGAFTPQKQQQIIQHAEQLPYHEYVKGTIVNIVDEDVHPIWRIQLLNNLMRLRYQQSVKFLWIDNKIYKINPVETTDTQDTVSYQKMMKLLKSKYEQTDPIKFEQLKLIINLDLQNLYPFIDKTIDNVHLWLKEIENGVLGVNKTENANDTNASIWLTKVNEMMASIMN
ncbi:hypothetical protein BGL34_02075 [Fructilactobacillus lindneri]|uniref:Uncharacterized protein n=2 Tax=Fructilactobacillus lindneri TaxID=53444 RepID=A0A0R2K294_9LACO|nr:hypothetical protein [Fructilactobacillus lindneri]ANZ58045.1 hypothetical protein AYR60_04510 [Fructilactobacillus lindneri]ANZ59366.1 hypothetical protein AYR59_04765 [Fructilactobacillus lindneri]KRN80666.1 hypothetical protein IV52_GL001222 [Fructilactobacillus lindneri DSM 20690 = JCM 11027]POG98850.1 hypothetical protein BGL31_02665 [Fructilactobacillus lindneri]POH03123.1 hypothetical protein BGL33_04100 [Fructilactobacillus lindneri]